jgi:hypothetical protein
MTITGVSPPALPDLHPARGWLVPFGRSTTFKDIELLVLRHEVVLRHASPDAAHWQPKSSIPARVGRDDRSCEAVGFGRIRVAGPPIPAARLRCGRAAGRAKRRHFAGRAYWSVEACVR